MTASVATQQTMRDIREMFDKWHVDMWEPIPDKLYASGVTLRYFRENTWQSS